MQLTKIDSSTQHLLPGMESIRINLPPHRQKESFDELSARSPISKIAGAAQCIARMKSLVPSRYPSWRKVLSPCVIGLFGLGIAIFFWGFAYKQSLYYGHATPSSRIPVARLCCEQRGASSSAASRFKAKSHLISNSTAFLVPIAEPARFNSAVAYIPSIFRRGIAYFDFLIPFRSPPSQRFCLA